MKNLFKKALRLTVICLLLVMSSCEKDLYEDAVKQTNRNKISFNQFMKETKIKDFQTLIKIPPEAISQSFSKTAELDEFVIDTVAIQRYVAENDKTTYSFRIYSIVSNVQTDEKYNLVYTKENDVWEKSIVSFKERLGAAQNENRFEEFQKLYDSRLTNTTMDFNSEMCFSETFSVHCDGSCSGECDGFGCPTGQCIIRTIKVEPCLTMGGNPTGPSDGNAGASGTATLDPYQFLPNTEGNQNFDADYINAYKADKFFRSLTYEAQQWVNQNIGQYNQLIQYQIQNNWSVGIRSFANWAIVYLIEHPELTMEDLLDNRTEFDTDMGDDNNNSEGNYDTTVYENFNPQQSPWPNIPSVIGVEDFVGWRTPGIKRNCMDYAKAQIAKKGFQISNYGATGQTIQIYTEQNGANETELAKGLSYLKYALSNGIPVIVGVDDSPGSPNPGTDNSTDHFIVIVGMGEDSNGKFFTFVDNSSGDVSQGTHPDNKLYYNPVTGIISGQSQTYYAQQQPHQYIVTMIRKSKPQ